jgi:hypothetical protein
MFRVILSVVFLAALQVIVCGQSETNCPRRMEYAHRNQVDPPVLTLNVVQGRTIDNRSDPVPEVCVALFTETSHRFVTQVSVYSDGDFKFGAVPPGRYRLVARVPRYDYFCPVNARILIRRSRNRSRLVLHMVMPAIDVCSWADTK